MADDAGEIIVKGGSTEISFDSAKFKKNGNTHVDKDVDVKQVIIEGHGQIADFKSGVHTGGFKGKIRILLQTKD